MEENQFDRVAMFFWVAVSLLFTIKWTLIWREEGFCNLKDTYVDISVTFKKCWQMMNWQEPYWKSYLKSSVSEVWLLQPDDQLQFWEVGETKINPKQSREVNGHFL